MVRSTEKLSLLAFNIAHHLEQFAAKATSIIPVLSQQLEVLNVRLSDLGVELFSIDVTSN